MISKDLLGCATSRNKGTCDNRLNIRRDALEASVLSGLRTHLMEPELFKEFCMAEIFRQRIAALYESLRGEDGKAEAAGVFRTLIEQVTLVPNEAELAIVLPGDLAAILRFAANKNNPDVLSEAGVLGALLSQESLVAGTGFEPVTFRL